MALLPFDLNGLTELPFGLLGRIYRSPMPFGPYDGDSLLFQAFQAADISGVVVLAEADECARKTGKDLLAFYRDQGLEVIHCPIPDFAVPERETLEQALRVVAARARAGKHTVVHCSAGIGRTGIFMACLAHQLLGMDAQTAIKWVRTLIPTAIESQAQVQFVQEVAG